MELKYLVHKYPVRKPGVNQYHSSTIQAYNEAVSVSEGRFIVLLNLFLLNRTISPIFILEFIKITIGNNYRYCTNNYKLILSILLSFDVSIFGEEAPRYIYIKIYLLVLQNFPTNTEDTIFKLFSRMTFAEQKVYDYAMYSLLINVPGIDKSNVWRNCFFVYFDINYRQSFDRINFNFKEICRPGHCHLIQLYDDILNEKKESLYGELKVSRNEIMVYKQQITVSIREHLIKDLVGIVVSYLNINTEGFISYLQKKDEYNKYIEIFRLL